MNCCCRNTHRPFDSFKGLSVLITGASSGFGEVFARELAREGAHLILTARSKEKLDALAADLKKTSGSCVTVFVSDLGLPEAPEQLFEAVQKAGLTVDILINNAGFGWCGRFEESTYEANLSLMAVNMNSLVALTRLFLPGMLAKGRGGVLNIGSTSAFQPMPYFAMYAASKSFVLSFSEAIWSEYKDRGIRVFCLCPGNTRTGFHRKAGIAEKEIFFGAKTEKVVRFGLDLFLHSDKPMAIYGWRNRFLTLGYRLLPRRWLIAITGLIFNRKK